VSSLGESNTGDDGSESMTLAFTLGALRRLADPAGAVADARQWAAHVGVAADRPRSAAAFARERGITDDFYAGETTGETLLLAGDRFETDRYVLIGTGSAHERAAGGADWEYLDVADAAEAAGWNLEPRGPGARLRDLWPF
jgi:hypothetical protein